jgi:hypothetical protein
MNEKRDEGEREMRRGGRERERENEREGEGRGEGGRRTKDEERASGKGVAKGGCSSCAADKVLGDCARPPHFRETCS